MNKLTHIRKALEDNSSITIVGVRERNHLQPVKHLDDYGHIVNFYVAPSTGGMYAATELQALMLSLIPDVEPNLEGNFREWDGEMELGRLYFVEVIGTQTIRHEWVLTDKEAMFAADDCVDGKCILEYTEDIQRRIWVHLFPNAQIADTSFRGETQYRISKSELAKYRSLMARIVSAFS